MWFKRDLRVHDNAPLVAASAYAEALAIFIIEPEWLSSPDCDASHVDFALTCLAELRAALAERGLPLLVRVGSAVQVLTQLQNELAFTHLLSHEETGAGWSYTRDRQISVWCASTNVSWKQFNQNGVIRDLRNRAG